MSADSGFRSSPSTASLVAKGVIAVLALMLLGLGWRLWPSWEQNPDLPHGRLVPVAFLILLYESRRHGTQRYTGAGKNGGVWLSVIGLAALSILGMSGLWAALLGWSHDLVLFSLTASASLLLFGALLVLSDNTLRIVPFNWASIMASMIWMLGAPIPPGTYTRLSISLQLWISGMVVKTLNALGIAAHQTGNIIELTRTNLGVDQACSGVRSLVSCMFAGVFLSAALVRKPSARLTILVLAPLLALVMNLCRSIFLALVANSGADISKGWHDAAGLTVTGITTLLLAGMALWLDRGQRKAQLAKVVSKSDYKSGFLPMGVLIASLVAALVVVGIFFYGTQKSSVSPGPTLQAASLLPEAPDGWQSQTSTIPSEVCGILKTTNLAETIYRKEQDKKGTLVSIYVAYWTPGQVPVSLVSAHTPDACWPGTGWIQKAPSQKNLPLVINGRTLSSTETREFANSGQHRYVWFWHIHNRTPIPYQDPYSFTRLLKISWQYGFRNPGDQLFVRIASNQPWSELSKELIIKDFFKRTDIYGL